MKLIARLTILASLLLYLTSCGSSSNSGALGVLYVNGPGIDGNIPTGTTRFYILKYINEGQIYTLRAEIPALLLPDGSETANGTLTVAVYSSESAYENNLPPEQVSVTPSTRFPWVYEGFFTAAASGDYVAVLSGNSLTNKDVQFFYNLRIMSADPVGLQSFVTPTILASNKSIIPGDLVFYNGGDVTSSGTYSLRLTSNASTTAGYPQLFIYSNNMLKADDLLYSSVTNSMNFNITSFPSPTGQGVTITSPVGVISGVTLTSASDGPYIMIKGVSAVTFSLSIEP